MNSITTFFALFVAFLWGIQVVIHKILLNSFNHQTIMIISGLFATTTNLIFTYYNIKYLQMDWNKINYKAIGLLFTSSIICGFFAAWLYYNILVKYNSYLVGTIVYSAPIFTLLFSIYILNEKPSIYSIFGILFVIIGLIFLLFNNK